jgi:ankyrin repeat protein
MNNIKTFENFNNQDIFTYIENNDIQSVKDYINSGYNLDSQNNSGDTPLILAASNNNRETVEILLDYGDDEFILDNNNKSFYYCLNDENKEYFTQNYPNSVYNAILHNYKK